MNLRHAQLTRCLAALLAIGLLSACADDNPGNPTGTTTTDEMTDTTMPENSETTMSDEMTDTTMSEMSDDSMTDTTSG
jgi:hypothetical protein